MHSERSQSTLQMSMVQTAYHCRHSSKWTPIGNTAQSTFSHPSPRMQQVFSIFPAFSALDCWKIYYIRWGFFLVFRFLSVFVSCYYHAEQSIQSTAMIPGDVGLRVWGKRRGKTGIETLEWPKFVQCCTSGLLLIESEQANFFQAWIPAQFFIGMLGGDLSSVQQTRT